MDGLASPHRGTSIRPAPGSISSTISQPWAADHDLSHSESAPPRSAAPAELRARHSSSVLTVTTPAGLERITVSDAAQARRILARHGDDVLDFEFRHGRMDDVFLALTGRTPDEGGRS